MKYFIQKTYRRQTTMLLRRDGLIWEFSQSVIPTATRQANAAKYPESRWQLALPDGNWEVHEDSPLIKDGYYVESHI